MDFKVFSTDTTNIFPMTNTTTGGQLLTEYNLRSMGSVATPESVNYYIGQSFVHGENDFYVLTSENANYFNEEATVPASGIVVIRPGRALVNGHFIESLVDVSIDLFEMNEELSKQGETELLGNLVIGLRAFYSTEETMAGSIKPEVIVADGSADYVFEGIQVVILPESEFILPEDSPNDESRVTAHIKLASFTLTNGGITKVKQNYPGKCAMLDSIRMGSVDDLLSDEYIKKTGLNPGNHYVYAGKGRRDFGNKDADTWCVVDDCLAVFDEHPSRSTNAPAYSSAQFITDSQNRVQLVLPHKQIDGSAGYYYTDTYGNRLYFDPVFLNVPKADYNLGTPGTVDKAYTNQIKTIAAELKSIYYRTGIAQKGYIDELNDVNELPTINQLWNPGDYILVAEDNTIMYEAAALERKPSTMYAVIPGIVNEVSFLQSGTPDNLTGTQLAYVEGSYEDNQDPPSTDDPDVYSTYWGDLTLYRGVKDKDYFVYNYTDENGVVTPYYYVVSAEGNREYSAPILLSEGVPLASEDTIGGFLNVPDTATDYGYVYVDSDGHLRLMDYALLRTGVLAYQLGEDFSTPDGVSNSEVQTYLDEYVNRRVAFPNENQTANSSANCIHIYIKVNAPDDESESIDLYDIDSRFATSVYVHLYGTSNENLTINISDCAKIRIENKVEGDININLYRSCLYYDATILSTLNIITDLSLWYEKFENTDPNLVVDGMTVMCSYSTSSTSVYADLAVSSSEYWSEAAPNDNHFMVALQGLTFGADGTITGANVLVGNDSTSNVSLGKSIIQTKFELPQGPSLYYPRKRMKNQIKVTGEFVSAYSVSGPTGYIVQDTRFSLLTPKYNLYEDIIQQGMIAFYVDASLVESDSTNTIDVWRPGSFHAFSGTSLMK